MKSKNTPKAYIHIPRNSPKIKSIRALRNALIYNRGEPLAGKLHLKINEKVAEIINLQPKPRRTQWIAMEIDIGFSNASKSPTSSEWILIAFKWHRQVWPECEILIMAPRATDSGYICRVISIPWDGAKLNRSRYLDGPAKLAQLQTSFADFLHANYPELGLIRGHAGGNLHYTAYKDCPIVEANASKSHRNNVFKRIQVGSKAERTIQAKISRIEKGRDKIQNLKKLLEQLTKNIS